MSETIELNEADFDVKVLQEKRPVLIDFWSPSCGPCRLLVPTLNALATANANVAVIAKVNVITNASLAAKLGVASLPALLIFKNGQVVSRLYGVQKQSKLQELIDAYL